MSNVPVVAAASSSSSSSSCDWVEVLLDADAYIGYEHNPNNSAIAYTRRKEWIVVSFWRERPPLPSRLYVHCPELELSAFSEPPRILRVVEGVILFRVAIRCRDSRFVLLEECDYFVYHVDHAELQLIPNPSPVSLSDDEVGLLPRGGKLYTVAALDATRSRSVFTLHLLHSEKMEEGWTSVEVSLKAPQSEFPVEIPAQARRLLNHTTSTVITLGGAGGTMGWVDLWRGILLCDVLCPNPELRGVPAPLPRKLFLPNDEFIIDPDVCPKPYRGIAFIKEKGCIRFVDLHISYQRVPTPPPDTERGVPSFRFDEWTITTWINSKLTSSFEDWEVEFMPLHADMVRYNDQMRLQLLEYQLLLPKAPPQQGSSSVAVNRLRRLQNLWVSRPTPSIDGSNVFLIARAKFNHPQAYFLAVDMGNGELQGVSEFRSGSEVGAFIDCCHGNVFKRERVRRILK